MKQAMCYKTCNSFFLFVLVQVKLSIQAYQECIQEMNQLMDQGFIYDPETKEVLVQVEKGVQRSFMFVLDSMYPIGGLQNVTVVGVEPMGECTLEEWNEKIHCFGVNRILELLPLLE
jgi:hypothetical protein